jgi:inner membrane protein
MIIGHAPSGYIIASLLLRKFSERSISPTLFFVAGVIGALAPDLDMLYFHLVDHRQHHHHTYFPHFPLLWLSLLSVSVAWLRLNKESKCAALAFVFCLGGFFHMVLDTIVGDIWWFAPFLDRPFAMFTVPALYKPWWLNFILHWSFALELSLWVWAFLIYRKNDSHLLKV